MHTVKIRVIMKYLIYIMILLYSDPSQLIFDFNKESDVRSWRIVNDGVMGGVSVSTLKLNTDGYGVFEGEVSLENNGGFASVRHRLQKMQVEDYTIIKIKLKGDGKNYQFRIRSDYRDYYSYIAPFSTTGKWQEIEIPLKDMYPSFRGRRLNQPNFSHEYIEEITFLIGNEKKESFKLLIDKIEIH